MIRKCPSCRAPGMTVERVPYRYDAGGLPHVTLIGVEVGRCAACGAESVTIPRLQRLHETIALTLAKKADRLIPCEVRFLRTYLGLSTDDLAARMGVARETVTRWQSQTSAQPMGDTAERLLRLMVVHGRPVADYPLEQLEHIGDAVREDALRFENDAAGWREAA